MLCQPCEAAPLGIFVRPQHVVVGSQGGSVHVMEHLSAKPAEREGKWWWWCLEVMSTRGRRAWGGNECLYIYSVNGVSILTRFANKYQTLCRHTAPLTCRAEIEQGEDGTWQRLNNNTKVLAKAEAGGWSKHWAYLRVHITRSTLLIKTTSMKEASSSLLICL